MSQEQDNKDIEDLLKKPEHTHPPDAHKSKNDDLTDPKNFDKSKDKIDPRWSKSSDGFDVHPDYK